MLRRCRFAPSTFWIKEPTTITSQHNACLQGDGLANLRRSTDGQYRTLTLHPQAGANLRHDVELVIAAYDTSSKIVGTGSCFFQAENFFGFDIFEAFIKIDVDDVKRIRIFPKQGN